jgi:polysaccharide pyruvyl transferase WcaK-like protein
VDVAFGLPVREPVERGSRGALHDIQRSGDLLLGLNVSGLLYNQPPSPGHDFGLRSSYRELIHALVRGLLQVPRARIVLVPHVVPPCTAEESDLRACEAVREALGEQSGSRVVLPMSVSDPMEAKWLIGQCDWFCGTRMHACIAALSQRRPALGLAYSDKALGVFETVGAGDWVVDLRRANAEEIVERVVGSVAQRESMAARLAKELPGAQSCLTEQFRSILAAVAERREAQSRAQRRGLS